MRGPLVVMVSFLVALMAISFVYNQYSGITGMQSYDIVPAANNTISAQQPEAPVSETVRENISPEMPNVPSSQVYAVVQSLAEDGAFAALGEGAAFCIVVGDNYYYELLKYKGQPLLTEKYCANPSQNNIVVKFSSYNSLLEFRQDPKKFIAEKRNTEYYVFPSNYVFKGGIVNCPVSFQLRYCGALYKYFSKDELANIQMPCCAYSSISPAGLAFFFAGGLENGWLVPLIALAAILAILLVLRAYRKK